MLYSILKPVTDDTAGNTNEEAQVFTGGDITGAEGNMTTLTMLLEAHDPGPAVPAVILPQAVLVTYRA